MSAATASSTETAIVHVRLLEENVDVWRPVEARRLGEALYRLADSPTPEDEIWTFKPGETVVAEHRGGALVAVARASDVDERSQRAYSLAG